MGKFTRVRYLRISRMCLEIVNGLTDKDKAKFLDQALTWFLKLEKGEEIELVETGNTLLNLALREEMAELQDGFSVYMKSVKARTSKETADESLMHQGTIIDASEAHLKEEDKEQEDERIIISESEKKADGVIFKDLEILSIQTELNHAGIIPDDAFWNTAQKYGYRATIDSIRELKEKDCNSLKQLTKTIKEKGKV